MYLQREVILMLLLFQHCWHFHFWSALEIGLFYSSSTSFYSVCIIFKFWSYVVMSSLVSKAAFGCQSKMLLSRALRWRC